MHGSITLALMARLPVPGQVKTRLAATLGDDEACAIYRVCAERAATEIARIPRVAATTRTRPVVSIADDRGVDAARAWLGDRVEIWQQRCGGLTERLVDVFHRSEREGAAATVVLASDTPDLDRHRLRRACQALVRAPAVIGPAPDGGFYLLGLRRLPRGLLDDLPWSTPEVLTVLRQRLRAHAVDDIPLPPLPDLDDEADLTRWRSEHPNPPFALRALHRIGAPDTRHHRRSVLR